jgi:hypothetical protein
MGDWVRVQSQEHGPKKTSIPPGIEPEPCNSGAIRKGYFPTKYNSRIVTKIDTYLENKYFSLLYIVITSSSTYYEILPPILSVT